MGGCAPWPGPSPPAHPGDRLLRPGPSPGQVVVKERRALDDAQASVPSIPAVNRGLTQHDLCPQLRQGQGTLWRRERLWVCSSDLAPPVSFVLIRFGPTPVGPPCGPGSTTGGMTGSTVLHERRGRRWSCSSRSAKHVSAKTCPSALWAGRARSQAPRAWRPDDSGPDVHGSPRRPITQQGIDARSGVCWNQPL